MTIQHHYFGRTFDDEATRMMGDAFVMAWHVVRASRPDGERSEIGAALQRDIASTVLRAAALGVLDPGTMAQAAIDRVRAAADSAA